MSDTNASGQISFTHTDYAPHSDAEVHAGVEARSDTVARTDAEARKPRFICEYAYTDELLARFAHLQLNTATGRIRKRALMIFGVVAACLAVFLLLIPNAPLWGVAANLALAAYALWHQANLERNTTKQLIRSMEQNETETGGRNRQVIITNEALTVLTAGGRREEFPLRALTAVERDGDLAVAVFESDGVALRSDGVALPTSGFTLGDAAACQVFLMRHLKSGIK